jgi:hypothetical protein
MAATERSSIIECVTKGGGEKLPRGRWINPIEKMADKNMAAARTTAPMDLNM